MQPIASLKVERPRKGSIITSVYDPDVGSSVLAEKMASGKLIVHKRLDALALVDIDLAREFCLRAGAATAGSTSPTTPRTRSWP